MTNKPGLSPAFIAHMSRIADTKGTPPPVVQREAIYNPTTVCEWCRKPCRKSYRTKETEWLCRECGNKHLDDIARESRRTN